MATDLYKEAIADAKALREMAEQNAKNKIIDVLTPQLRSMIERQLLGEQVDETSMDADEVDIEMETGAEGSEEATVDAAAIAAPVAQALDAVTVDLDTMASAEAQTSVQVDPGSGASVKIDADGSVDISSSGVDVEVGASTDAEGEEEDLILSTESARALAKLLRQPKVMEQTEIAERLAVLVKTVRRLDRVLEGYSTSRMSSLQRETIRKHYRKMLQEAITLRNQVILSEVESNNNRLNERAELIFKEIKKMARRRKSALFDRIFESEHRKDELDELDAVLSLEPADEEEAGEVEELLGDLEVEFELESPEGGDEGGDEGGEEMELGAEEEVEEEVIEIDESMLRRELLRMRRLREQEEGRAAEADPALAHGGEDEGDSFVEVSEDDLINALADELGDPDVATPEAPSSAVGAGSTDAMPEVRRRLARRLAERRRANARSSKRNRSTVNESRNNRALRSKLVEYRQAVGSLKGQLEEMNLFNAKLLYVNKLMQNRNVTPKQQRVIVEALDNAKTIREAKLLYQSLSASANKKGSLSEGRVRRSLGSASKSARSAQPITEGAGVDRWAVLAGVTGKDNN
jgi:hypothetical protein